MQPCVLSSTGLSLLNVLLHAAVCALFYMSVPTQCPSTRSRVCSLLQVCLYLMSFYTQPCVLSSTGLSLLNVLLHQAVCALFYRSVSTQCPSTCSRVCSLLQVCLYSMSFYTQPCVLSSTGLSLLNVLLHAAVCALFYRSVSTQCPSTRSHVCSLLHVCLYSMSFYTKPCVLSSTGLSLLNVLLHQAVCALFYRSVSTQCPSTCSHVCSLLHVCLYSMSFYTKPCVLSSTGLYLLNVLLHAAVCALFYMSVSTQCPSTRSRVCSLLHVCLYSMSFYTQPCALSSTGLSLLNVLLHAAVCALFYRSVSTQCPSTRSRVRSLLQVCLYSMSFYTQPCVLSSTGLSLLNVLLHAAVYALFYRSVSTQCPSTRSRVRSLLQVCLYSMSFYTQPCALSSTGLSLLNVLLHAAVCALFYRSVSTQCPSTPSRVRSLLQVCLYSMSFYTQPCALSSTGLSLLNVLLHQASRVSFYTQPCALFYRSVSTQCPSTRSRVCSLLQVCLYSMSFYTQPCALSSTGLSLLDVLLHAAVCALFYRSVSTQCRVQPCALFYRSVLLAVCALFYFSTPSRVRSLLQVCLYSMSFYTQPCALSSTGLSLLNVLLHAAVCALFYRSVSTQCPSTRSRVCSLLQVCLYSMSFYTKPCVLSSTGLSLLNVLLHQAVCALFYRSVSTQCPSTPSRVCSLLQVCLYSMSFYTQPCALSSTGLSLLNVLLHAAVCALFYRSVSTQCPSTCSRVRSLLKVCLYSMSFYTQPCALSSTGLSLLNVLLHAAVCALFYRSVSTQCPSTPSHVCSLLQVCLYSMSFYTKPCVLSSTGLSLLNVLLHQAVCALFYRSVSTQCPSTRSRVRSLLQVCLYSMSFYMQPCVLSSTGLSLLNVLLHQAVCALFYRSVSTQCPSTRSRVRSLLQVCLYSMSFYMQPCALSSTGLSLLNVLLHQAVCALFYRSVSTQCPSTRSRVRSLLQVCLFLLVFTLL